MKDPILVKNHIIAKPVTCVLPEQNICVYTRDYTLEKNHINAKPVTSVLHNEEVYGVMKEPMLDRNHFDAKPVTSVLEKRESCRNMRDYTEKSHINAKPVISVLARQDICEDMKDHTLERSFMNASISSQPASVSQDGEPGHVNTFTCWICQDELSSAALLSEHYDDHMNI
ncbi:hypothetical protein ACROYT_G028226 [Oculina patagonica]